MVLFLRRKQDSVGSREVPRLKYLWDDSTGGIQELPTTSIINRAKTPMEIREPKHIAVLDKYATNMSGKG
jgi:hypothetical protein